MPRRLVSIALAAAGAASQAEGNRIFGENGSKTKDLTCIQNSDQHALAFRSLLLNLLQHRGNRAVEARRGLRVERQRLSLSGALDPEVFNIRPWQSAELSPPFCGREIQISRPYQIADSAPFMSLFDAGPGVFELGFQILRFVGDDESARQ